MNIKKNFFKLWLLNAGLSENMTPYETMKQQFIGKPGNNTNSYNRRGDEAVCK